jgi:hypothetical protein
MYKQVGYFLVAAMLMGVGLVGSASAQDEDTMSAPIIHRINEKGTDYLVKRKGVSPEAGPRGEDLTEGSTGTALPNMTYHGGPLIQTPVIYLIWYGNWNQSNGSDNPAGQQIIRDWANTIGGSPYFQLNQTASAGSFTITGNVTFRAEATDTGSQGSRLSDSRVFNVVIRAINNGLLPYDANGVYFVLTSTNISESSGFCSRYCGWHTSGTSSGRTIRFSFVGNAHRCLNACAAQTTSPNGNAGVDAMISVMSHELEESTTDPDLNAWFDSNGAENGDKCAWTFGHRQYQTSNGAFANVQLGSRNFLIQRNIQITSSGDYCMMNSTQN